MAFSVQPYVTVQTFPLSVRRDGVEAQGVAGYSFRLLLKRISTDHRLIEHLGTFGSVPSDVCLCHPVKESQESADPIPRERISGTGIQYDAEKEIKHSLKKLPADLFDLAPVEEKSWIEAGNLFCIVRRELTEGGICKSQHFIKNDVPAA